jgi:arylsulfatase A-like enzyme
MRSFQLTILLVAVLFGSAVSLAADDARGPNVVMILIDDMGYGDLRCYGNPDIETPSIDRLAAEGIMFRQFTVASPICSPSRVGITTGQYPARHRINSYLNNRQRNRERGMVDFLDPAVPTVARTFQNAGYATAHFGKWHMGGGRDVDDAPLPQAYGFDESLVSFEGLGDRLLINGQGLSQQSAELGQGEITWVDKHQQTPMYVDRSIDFITRNRERPFYLHLWLNDVHDAFAPTEEQLAKFAEFAANPYLQQYYAVIDAMDREIGRLVDAIDEMGLAEQTLIVLASDNGPTAWPRYDREGFDAPGSTGGHRGRKWSLYEGGIREPLIVRWKGRVPAGREDRDTVIGAVDLFPTFCALAGIDADAAIKEQKTDAPAAREHFDGVDMSQAILGTPVERGKPLFWEYGRDDSYLQPAQPIDRSPNLAVRRGKWKLLMNADGSRIELYDLTDSWKEFYNRAGDFPEVRDELVALLNAWKESLPGYVEQTSKVELAPPQTIELQAGMSKESNQLPSVVDADIRIEAEVTTAGRDGVIVAHGGAAAGYALYIHEGHPQLTLRVRGEATTIRSPEALPADRSVRLAGHITADKRLILIVDGNEVASTDVNVLLNTQPVDSLDVGRDLRGNVGDYEGNFPFGGMIAAARVTIQPVKTKAVAGGMVTRWAMEVEPEFPHKEYPRPQFRREQWLNLNGQWQYAIRPKDEGRPEKWDGRITVPFPVESTLSGVQRRVSKDERLWYRRTFRLPEGWGPGVQLNFGAVDWETRVWVNGQEVTKSPHRGGYDPFSYLVTEQLFRHPESESDAKFNRFGKFEIPKDLEHEIVVSVWDPTSDGPQPRGKQLNNPRGIWYTPVTGIWQPVWIEPVSRDFIRSMKVTPDVDAGTLTIDFEASVGRGKGVFDVTVQGEGDPLSARSMMYTSQAQTDELRGQVVVPVPDVRLWSPEDPYLYDIGVTFRWNLSIDEVKSYAGMRKIELRKDAAGVDRLFLNGEPLFQYGPLDQGWWPDGLYTAPTDQALRFDIQQTKDMGFNMIRKHVKIEPARWYFHCDKLGILVWQDMPSGMDKTQGDRANHVHKGEPDLKLDDEAKAIFRHELQAMIENLYNHPSIVVWVPFNEGWGQHDTNEILKWTKQLDPTRLVGGPSGWEDRGYGDLLDMHKYPGPDMFGVTDGRASVLGEFGGLGLPVPGHTWVDQNNWGYRTYGTHAELQQNYRALIEQLPALIERGLAAAVYTQTTDVEVEVNGLMTYDRAHTKFDPENLRRLHPPLYETAP